VSSLHEWLATPILGHAVWLWLAFASLIGALLAFDLGVLHRRDREIGVAESLKLTAGYVGVALAFGAWIWWYLGAESGVAWLTGYAIEKSLSLDNVFVIAVILGFFAVPPRYQHRVLFWGILGALAMRAVMIVGGAALLHRFEWVMLLFAAFLVVTGVRLWRHADRKPDLAGSPLLKLFRRLPVTPAIEGPAFVVRRADPASGRIRRWATPLALALCLVELTDLVFAIDSIPAIFTVTTDPFLVYTSNVFAILGLRALYFALAASIERFRFLRHALALILVFIGGRVLAAEFGVEIPPALSLAVTLGLLGGGIGASSWKATRTSWARTASRRCRTTSSLARPRSG
jgi:tellurite resistance protein TerC